MTNYIPWRCQFGLHRWTTVPPRVVGHAATRSMRVERYLGGYTSPVRPYCARCGKDACCENCGEKKP